MQLAHRAGRPRSCGYGDHPARLLPCDAMEHSWMASRGLWKPSGWPTCLANGNMLEMKRPVCFYRCSTRSVHASGAWRRLARRFDPNAAMQRSPDGCAPEMISCRYVMSRHIMSCGCLSCICLMPAMPHMCSYFQKGSSCRGCRGGMGRFSMRMGR